MGDVQIKQYTVTLKKISNNNSLFKIIIEKHNQYKKYLAMFPNHYQEHSQYKK